MSDKALEQMTVPGLCDSLDRFINSNRRATNDTSRWLADYLCETLRVVQRVVRSGGSGGSLDETEKKLVVSFLLGEIEAAKASKQREIVELDRRAKKLAAG